MGCDIHVLTEKKFKDGWVNIDNWNINPYYDGIEEKREYDINYVYHDRDYELFTVLANVRNYYNSCEYISEPKGLPEDMHKATKEYVDYWDCDGHSHSWFTLKELYDYWLEMPTRVKRTGILIGDVLEKFDKDGKEPEEWCQGFWGNAKSERREWEAKHDILYSFMTSLIKRFCEQFYIYFVKEEDYKTSDKIKEAIEKFGEEFRVIFFFDN